MLARDIARVLVPALVIAIAIAALSAGAPTVTRHAATPSGYDVALAACGRRVSEAERLARAAPRSWIRRGELASAHLACGRLTGRYTSFAAAERAIDDAFALTGGRIGPWLVRAELSFTLHRFDAVERDLLVVERDARRRDDQETLAHAMALRGSLALERGRYDEARELLGASREIDPSHGVLARIAHLHVELGEPTIAEDWLDAAEAALPDGADDALAWVHLQRGLIDLERDDSSAALTHYQQADAAFGGWWLVQEHIAEAEAKLGRVPSAIARYRKLVAQTGDPELMDALAELLPADEAQQLIVEARAIFESRLAEFPEATYGHALDHFLEHDPNPTRAVELAEKNAALRPNDRALTQLAAAYLAADRVAEARTTLTRVRRTEAAALCDHLTRL